MFIIRYVQFVTKITVSTLFDRNPSYIGYYSPLPSMYSLLGGTLVLPKLLRVSDYCVVPDMLTEQTLALIDPSPVIHTRR